MRHEVIILSFILTLLVKQATPYGTGAPSAACVTMTPRHIDSSNPGSFIQSQDVATSPYSISVAVDTYGPGDVVQVTVTDSRTPPVGFRGILLQGRNANPDVPLGTWVQFPANTKLTNCTNVADSATHANTELKASGTIFHWQAPQTNIGTVQFMATVAENHDTFWVKLQANKSITYSSATNLRLHSIYLALSSVIALRFVL